MVALCDGEVVERVTLLSVEDDRRSPIGQIDGRATGDVFAVTVGEVPEGFVETIPLRAPDLARSHTLGLVTDTTRGAAADSEHYFTVEDLRVGFLDDGLFGSDGATLEDLRLRADLNCDPLGVPWRTPPLALKLLYVAVAVGGVVLIGGATGWAVRTWRRQTNASGVDR